MAYNWNILWLREASETSAVKMTASRLVQAGPGWPSLVQAGPGRSRPVQAGPGWTAVCVLNVKISVVEEIVLMAECF